VHLVRATASLLARVPDARAVIVGLPIDPEPVRRAIGEAGLEGRVLLAGYHPAAARLLPAFDVFALPSLHEGMPLSLLEAMALGIPVVAARVGGVPEVVTDGVDGVVVPPADDDALATALADLLLDGERRRELAEAGRSTAERFSLAAAVRRTEDVYDEALAARASR
jgi:glycosyltransferase involved in cell wall biosynthesis